MINLQKRIVVITSTLLIATLAACGGSPSTPVLQKNSALTPTTMNVADAKNKAAADAAAAAAAAKAAAIEAAKATTSTTKPVVTTTIPKGTPTTMNLADAKNKAAGR
ncbi:MAG: hypothetical protein RJA15_245 [Actinomycetota bacterium]|jgi:hypothetical protein